GTGTFTVSVRTSTLGVLIVVVSLDTSTSGVSTSYSPSPVLVQAPTVVIAARRAMAVNFRMSFVASVRVVLPPPEERQPSCHAGSAVGPGSHKATVTIEAGPATLWRARQSKTSLWRRLTRRSSYT